MRLLAASAALTLAFAARAQPLEPVCYEPDRLGWAGPALSLGCLACCNCRDATLTMEWALRLADAGWTGAEPLHSAPGRFATWPQEPLTHQTPYCMRVRFADGQGPGAWGPTTTATCGPPASDLCFTWDDAPPSTPTMVLVSSLLASNQFNVNFMPSTDDGGGVLTYTLHYQDGVAQFGFGTGATTPLSDVLGAGTWQVSVFAEDRAGNRSARTSPISASFGFDASIPVPTRPFWPGPASNAPYVTATWVDDGANSWVVTQRALDGGWRIGTRPRVASPSAYLDTPGPCRTHAVRVASVFGSQVSAWSQPSLELLADTVVPAVGAPTVARDDAGFANVQWPVATDGCPSGLSYRLERSVDDAGWAARITTNSLTALDSLDVDGRYTWRVVAIDGAGNEGPSAPSAVVVVVPLDAGLPDAGAPDAGRPDAGTPDAGLDAGAPDAGAVDAGTRDAGVRRDAGVSARKELGVGCGCTGATPDAVLLALAVTLALARTRRALGKLARSTTGSAGRARSPQ